MTNGTECYYVRDNHGKYLANVPKQGEKGIWFSDEDAAYPFQTYEEADFHAKSFDAHVMMNAES